MEEDLKEASASLADLPRRSSYAPRPGKKRPKIIRRFIQIVGIMILLGALAYASVKFLVNKDHENITKPVQTTSLTSTIKTETNKLDANTREFKGSESIGIDLDYPSDWTVTEAGGGITVLSPTFTYETLNGDNAEGNFKIYIRKGARTEDGNYLGKAVAVKDSIELDYTKPTIGQNKKTLLQTFGYNDTNNFAYFFLASNYRLKAGDTLGRNYGKESNTILVAGGYSDPSLKNDFEMNKMSLDKYDSYKQYKQAISIIQTLRFN